MSLLSAAPNLFGTHQADPAHAQRLLAADPARTRLVIHFTPRSSSTRLTEILAATKRLGHANEAFNPEFVATISRGWRVTDIETYTRLLPRQHVLGGVWSCEITAHHLQTAFPRDQTAFLRETEGAAQLWLIRQDIVAQAVSLARMVATGVGHSFSADATARQRAEQGFGYDPHAIRRWLSHIRRAERGSEAFFERNAVVPLRLSYEQLVRMSPQSIVDLVTDHLELPRIGGQPLDDAALANQKLGSDRSAEFAARFRREHPRLMARLGAARAPMLEALADLGQPVPTARDLRARAPGAPVLLGQDRLREGLRRLAHMLIKSR